MTMTIPDRVCNVFLRLAVRDQDLPHSMAILDAILDYFRERYIREQGLNCSTLLIRGVSALTNYVFINKK